LSNTDFRTLEAVTGFFREYMDRVHFVEPEKALDAALKDRWRRRAPCAAKVEAAMRGEFMQRAMSACATTR